MFSLITEMLNQKGKFWSKFWGERQVFAAFPPLCLYKPSTNFTWFVQDQSATILSTISAFLPIHQPFRVPLPSFHVPLQPFHLCHQPFHVCLGLYSCGISLSGAFLSHVLLGCRSQRCATTHCSWTQGLRLFSQ